MLTRLLIRSVIGMVVVIVGLLGCNSLPPLPPPVAPEIPVALIHQPEQTDLKLGPEDVVNIIVYDHNDLSMSVVVAADGSFSYPLLDHVRAEGLTAQELQTYLTKALSEYIVKPQVSVTVKQFQSQQAYVVGEVRSPGTYTLKHVSTLLELLVGAGGPTGNAGWEVLIVRDHARSNGEAPTTSTPESKERVVHIDLEKLLAGGIPSPIQIDGGDTIYVPKAAFFYIDGQVRRPGRYRLERDMTVAKALTIAGGPTQFAAESLMKVRRVINGQRREFSVHKLDLLQADDVLIVPESIF